MIVPFARIIRLGSVGRDVIGAKRAIWRANGHRVTLKLTPLFGPVSARELRRFQHKHGLAADGQLGPATLKKLAAYFDAYAFLLYVGYPPGSNPRQRIVAYCLWAHNNRERIHYRQYRPMDLLNDLKHLPVWDDCSEFATKAFKWGGVEDPNGRGYDGQGFTGTLADHGQPVTLAQARPGDLVFYGAPPNFSHVAVYVGAGRVVSHGSEAGPYLLNATYRAIAQIRSYLR